MQSTILVLKLKCSVFLIIFGFDRISLCKYNYVNTPIDVKTKNFNAFIPESHINKNLIQQELNYSKSDFKINAK